MILPEKNFDLSRHSKWIFAVYLAVCNSVLIAEAFFYFSASITVSNGLSFSLMSFVSSNSTLHTSKKIYLHIRYSVVLAYLPKKDIGDLENALYPDGLENTPLRFAIDRRNRIMIGWSDTAVTYVCHSFGGAAKYEKIAKKKGRQVINLFDFV